MREIPPDAQQQCGVFSLAQAVSCGWTQSALRCAVRAGQVHRLRAAAFQAADLGHLDEFAESRWRHAAPAIGAALTTPGAQASHSTAAVLQDLPLAFLPTMSCATVVPWHTGEIRRVHVHRTTSAGFTLPVGHVECTSIARTVVDLAREQADSLREEKVRQEELEETGLIVVRWGQVQLATFEVVADRVRRAFARGRARRAEDRRWSVLRGLPPL